MKHDIPFSVAPFHQTNWDWRAAGNFIGGGSGSGLLLFAAAAGGEAYRIAVVLALILIGTGLTCVWLEIGKPLRAINVFRHPGTSWMTREGIVALFLFPAALIALVSGGGMGGWVAAGFAMLFLYCQMRILLASKGIPAWREPRIRPLILVSGLTEGCGWAVLASAAIGAYTPQWMIVVLAAAAAARMWAWRAYLAGLRRRGAPRKALSVLARFGRPFLLAGGALPAMAAIASLAGGGLWLAAAAGVLAALAGWAMKYAIVARAAFNQGFALPMLPVRGVGVPGPAVKPGWSIPAANAQGVRAGAGSVTAENSRGA